MPPHIIHTRTHTRTRATPPEPTPLINILQAAQMKSSLLIFPPAHKIIFFI